MQHSRSETPIYMIWVEQRPSSSGKGKQAYFKAVECSARQEINTPITTNDIEVEIVYCTSTQKSQRIDADNVNKPTLDALKGVAYLDDAQVRSVRSTLFDRNLPATVSGRVEHMGQLFYANQEHMVLIMIYSDSRLVEVGGEQEVQRQRYLAWQHNFDQMFSEIKKRAT